MAKKKYYDEEGNQIRSRASKPFYKKWSLWAIIFVCVLFGSIGMYTFGNAEKNANNSVAEKENTKEVETKNDLEEKNIETEEKAQTYTFEDFKGTYVQFIGEPYNSAFTGMSHITVISDESYRTFNRWDYDMTSPIINKSIAKSTLTLDLDSTEDHILGPHSESGTEQFELRFEGNKKILYSITKDVTFYSMSTEDLQTHYSQKEIDYTRILMTLRGVPSLDFWAAYSSEYEGDKPIIGVSRSKKGDFIPYITDVDEVGFPEDVTTLYLQNKTRMDEISYTYASIEDGYIRVYPVPLNFALRSGDEVINEAKEHYIEPFEPYEVADFIGHVEYDLE